MVRRVRASGTSDEELVVLMKRAYARVFGLSEIASNDPVFFGTFSGNASNAGSRFVRNIGGFRALGYQFIPRQTLMVEEEFFDDNGNLTTNNRTVRTAQIGFPVGVAVNEIIGWLLSLPEEVGDLWQAIRTPDGRRIPFQWVSGGSLPAAGGGGTQPPPSLPPT